MTALRTAATVVLAAWMMPGLARAEGPPSVKDMLRVPPTMKGVEFDTPNGPAADGCKVEAVLNAQQKTVGWAVRDSQGRLLRRFVIAHKSRAMDQWSYYQDGFEVYRETDLDNDTYPDECRWMNSGGTRVAALSRGKLTGWKRISAEEASKVLVQGLLNNDLGLIESVMVNSKELAALGVAPSTVEQVLSATAGRQEAVEALRKGLKGWWTTPTVWGRFDCAMPHLIPADPATGASQDLVVYENAIIFVSPADPQAAPGAASKLAFLQAPELIQVGQAWKFVELPRAIDAEKPVLASEGRLRASLFRQQEGPAGAPANGDLDKALQELAQYDNTNGKLLNDPDKKQVAKYHVGRIPKLRAVVKASTDSAEQLGYNRQVVDSLAAAYQTGFYPNGVTLLDKIIAEKGKLGSYAAFRKISATFALKNEEPGANVMANQKAWLSDLKAFLTEWPDAEELPEALSQVANVNEYNAEEDEARTYYNRLVKDYPATEAGKKAAGALKRLDLVGKTIDLKGPGLQNEPIDLAKYRGKTVLIAFWATSADPVRRDLPELLKLYKKYQSKSFDVVAVDLDNTREELDAFLKENSVPWPEIFQPGGVERNPYAVEYGIIAIPTMILVDSTGKVVNRNIRSSADLERQLEKVIDGKQASVAVEK